MTLYRQRTSTWRKLILRQPQKTARILRNALHAHFKMQVRSS